MATPDKDLMTRLTELVEEYGHQWKQIAPVLATEGYRDRRGNPYSDNYLRKRMKRQETGSQGKLSKPSEAMEPPESSTTDIHDRARAVISLLTQERLLESAVKEVLASLECTTPGQQPRCHPSPSASLTGNG